MKIRTSLSAPAKALLLAMLVTTAPLPAFSQTNAKASRFYEDALVRYEKKDMAGAIIQLKNALQIDRSMLQVHVLLGRALLANNEVVAAEVAFEEALRLGVNRAEVVVPMAQAVAAQAKAPALLSEPRFAETGLPPGVRAQLLLTKASAANDMGNPREALGLIEQSRAIDASRTEAWLAEVPVRLRALQIREATAAADKALAIDPGSAEALYLRGTIPHLLADRDNALAWYDKALKARPAHTEALVARAGLLLDMNRFDDATRDIAELRKTSADDPRGAYLAALISERKGDTTATRASLNAVTALLDPVPMEFLRYRPQLLMLGGLAHYGLNQREKAKPYLEMAKRSQPGSPVSKLLAHIYLGEQNVDLAIESLESYLRAHPNDTQATQLLASAQLSKGRHARATALMQDALRKQDLPELRSVLGLSLISAGKYTAAITELENAVRRDPGQVQAGAALVAIYLQSDQPANAVRVAEVVVKQQPGSAALQNMLGTARARAGNVSGARAAFDQALKRDPQFLAPQVNIAKLEADNKAYDAAITRLNAVLAKNDKYVDAMMELGRIYRLRGQMDQAQRWLEKADDNSGTESLQAGLTLLDFHLANGRPDLAVEAVKRLTNRAPGAPSVLKAMARANLANGDLIAARATLNRAAVQASYDAPALVEIGMMQLKAGDVPGAAHSLDKALTERPDFLPAQLVMADVEIRQGELAKAEQRARRVVADNPKLGVGHALIGDVAMARNQRPAALEAYRRAHQLQPSTDNVLKLFLALAVSDGAAATQLAEQWLMTDPGDTVMRRALADAQARSGNLAAARATYEALLKTSPDDAEAMNNLANVLLLANDPRALQMAERALAKKPAAPHIIGTAGWAAFKAGQTDRALQLLRDARLRDPNNPDTRYFLGAVLASNGRATEAREELEGAMRLSGTFAGAKEAETLLKTLK